MKNSINNNGQINHSKMNVTYKFLLLGGLLLIAFQVAYASFNVAIEICELLLANK